MIYVSTGGNRSISGYESAFNFLNEGFKAVELSGGTYDEQQLEKLKVLKKGLSLQIHNYFPPPVEPFVLNLASNDPHIFHQSLSHVKKGIRWAIELGNPVYSFHAGFLFDPRPIDLGNHIEKRPLADRKESLELFIKRVNDLASEFNDSGVTLLVENNVLSNKNLSNFGCNPFLLTESSEANLFMSEMPENVKLLIDVAHVKVTASTLKFEPEKMLIECAKWTYAYHLSDNDGITDSNSPVSSESWFWPHLKKNVEFYVLEVYNISNFELLQQVSLISRMLKMNEK
uniref:sugar phosphate isomerase/epimerase family protein n=1 Tax=Algoriphagus sp. TaxID=1872435 RepID=UPI004048355C